MTDRNKNILNILEKDYPEARCELEFSTPFELLVAVVLSAQCTDKRVNIVTREMFGKVNTPQGFAGMSTEQIEEFVRPCGFYRNKAKAIKELSEDIVKNYGGKVPDSLDELVKLKGVGNKTAAVVYSVAFRGEALPVDTHVFRVSHRLSLSDGKTADAVMEDLKRQFPSDKWYTLHHTMIFHGRYTCKSRKPLCGNCNLNDYCTYYKDLKNEQDFKS